MNIVASLPKCASMRPGSLPPRARRRIWAFTDNDIGVTVRLQHLQTSNGDHVAHGYTSAIATMKLEALHKASVRQALESPLCGCR
jgi:hypothetical protein